VLTAALVVVVGVWLSSTIGAYAAELDLDGLTYPHLTLSGFVMFNAVVPIFPSETLLNTASTLVAQGKSDLDIEQNEKVKRSMKLLDERAGMVIVFGRFVPGVRFVVGATMGLTRYTYGRFLLWDSIGSLCWAAFSCISSYLVGSPSTSGQFVGRSLADWLQRLGDSPNTAADP
jgi:membrane protein DedA with SNARE-associated domain